MAKKKTTISISPEAHDAIKGVVRSRGMKVYTAVDAMVRGWHLLGEDQQDDAIRRGTLGVSSAQSVGSSSQSDASPASKQRKPARHRGRRAAA